jgi:hypothetical protein
MALPEKIEGQRPQDSKYLFCCKIVQDNNITPQWNRCVYYITLHCIAFHGSKARQNDCRMWNMSHKYKNICTVQLQFSHKKTKENTVVTHEAIEKYIHIHTPILFTYAIYTAFKWMSHFLDNKYSSTE